jgi:ADP-ribose pyrophosphatase YjhB (NUDIX family)
MIEAILPLADASGMVAAMINPIASPPQTPHAPRPKPVLGVSVCVWRDGKVLLIERGNPPARGLWAPVGGRVEWGETLEAAARREVHEEAAIACDIVGFSQVREMIEPENGAASGHHVVLAVFAARWVAGDIAAGDDASAVAWVDPTVLTDYALVPGVIPYIEATRRLIEDMA